MVGRLAVVLAVAYVLAQVAAGDVFRTARRRRLAPAGAEWVWGPAEDATEARQINYRLRPEGDDAALLAYFSGVLSTVCCNAGQTFHIGSKTCRKVVDRSEPLLLRSGLTTLPPNCPPPTKYDPESKRCRDVWD